jgi:carbon storage regulator
LLTDSHEGHLDAGESEVLAIKRKKNESFVIGGSVLITVVDIRGNKARIRITAPKTVAVHRQEVQESVEREMGEGSEHLGERSIRDQIAILSGEISGPSGSPLVLSRKEGESLVIGHVVVVKIQKIREQVVSFAVEAPRQVPIHKSEHQEVKQSPVVQASAAYETSDERTGGESRAPDVSPPVLAVAWDPQLLTEDEYAELIGTLGDLVRAHGGAGIRRLLEEDAGIVGSEVLQP